MRTSNFPTKHKTRPLPGRPPAGLGPDSRTRILDSAFTLIADQGATGTTVAQIAQAAGVTPAMVHYHFGNRDGLLDALVDERLAPVIAFVWEAVPDEPEAGFDALAASAAFVDRLLDAVERLPLLPALWSREILSGGGLLRERLLRHVPENKVAALCRALTEAQQAGRMHPDALPGLVPAAVMGLVMLPLAARFVLDRLPEGTAACIDRESLRRHALAILLHGLVPRETPKTDPES